MVVDGKKNIHVATPYPTKKGGKTPKSGTKGQSPNSAGQLSCGTCKKYDCVFKNSSRPWRIALRSLCIMTYAWLFYGCLGLSTTKLVCNNIRSPSMVVSDLHFTLLM